MVLRRKEKQMKRKIVLTLALIGLSGLLPLGGNLQAASLAEMVPGSTMMIIESSSPASIWKSLTDNKVGPAVSKEKLEEAWTELMKGAWVDRVKELVGVQPLDFLVKYPERLGVVLGDVRPLLRAAVEGDEPTPDMVPFALCLQAGEDREEFAGALDTFFEKCVELGIKEGKQVSIRKETYHELPFFVFDIGNKGNSEVIKALYYTWVGEWFFLTFSQPALQQILTVAEGAPALAAREGYQKDTESFRLKEGTIAGYFDIEPARKATKELIREQAMSTTVGADSSDQVTSLIDLLVDFYFGQIKSQVFRIECVQGGVVADSLIVCDPARKKGFAHLIGKKQKLSFPAWMWKEAQFVATAAVDWDLFWKSLSDLMEESMKLQAPGGLPPDAWKSTFTAFLGVSPDELVASLGDQIFMAVGSEKEEKRALTSDIETIDPERLAMALFTPQTEMLFSFSLKRTDVWEQVLRQIAVMASGELKETDYMGNKLLTWETLPGFAFLTGVVNKMFMLGSRELVEKAIRRFGKEVPGIADDAEVKEALSVADNPNAMLVYSSGAADKSLEYMLLKIVEKEFQKETAGEADPVGKELAEGLQKLLAIITSPGNWENKKLQTLITGSWEERGLRMKLLELFRQ